jgi:transcriptional regulator with XRE-family HTH domain
MRPKNPTPPPNRLRELRQAMHLSQEGLGARVGLTASAVSRHENRERAITEEQAEAYAQHLGAASIW